MSENRMGTTTLTPQQIKLGDALNKLKLTYKFDHEIPREGKPPYRLDLAIWDYKSLAKLAIEIYGKGTSSDDWDRDRYIKGCGWPCLYFPNALVENHMGFVLTRIQDAIVDLRRYF